MVAGIVTGKNGLPITSGGKSLTPSALVLPHEVRKFILHFQTDYTTAWNLQRKPFDEFDGYSLLERAKLDQETFGAFVGIQYLPKHKQWRWKGRKNTARNKLIGILAHLLAGMLFPFVYAQNERDEEDKMTARVMGIMIEEHLRKARYELKFLYLMLSALVNPAVFAGIEYVHSMQRIKQRLQNGEIKVMEAVDEIMSGTQLNIIPIDEMVLGDFYSGTGFLHAQPHIFRVRRISYDHARSIYAGKFFTEDGRDLFDFVRAGTTRWVETSANNTLYDVEWDEVDGNFVQEVTGYYRSEDLEVPIVGGVPMCEHKEIYNANPFNHRRMAFMDGAWMSVPIYPFAMSGFEPLDPSGRFAYYKSGAFKEYWDDQKLNKVDRLAMDGMNLDVMKPVFLSGVAKFDSTAMVPGATVSMPLNASVTPYSLGPNLAAAYKAIQDANQDISESTQDKVMQGTTEPGVTATQTIVAQRQARIFLGVFGLLVADLIKQIGELTMDCVIQYSTRGELEALVPEALRLKFKTFIAKGKDKGREVTNRIVFSDRYMGKTPTKDQARKREWEIYDQAGGEKSDQRIYEVNPYLFTRTSYTMFVDADKIVARSMGTDRQQKDLAFEKLTDPRVMPFTNPEAVVNDFVIEEYAESDPERYKRQEGDIEATQAMQAMMGLTRGGESGAPQLSKREKVTI